MNRGSIINNSSIIAKGEGPGGTVTGIATLNGQVYAVSDQGGLYRINDPFNFAGNDDDVADDVHRHVPRGLAGHPLLRLDGRSAERREQRLQQHAVRHRLGGTLYAFDTAGEAQPVFVNGATSVSTGNHGGREIRGLAFSTLDENLFEQTPTARQIIGATPMDVRLGIAAQVGQLITVDKQQFTPGHERYQSGTSSIHFGQGNVNGNPRSYDFPGGATARSSATNSASRVTRPPIGRRCTSATSWRRRVIAVPQALLRP